MELLTPTTAITVARYHHPVWGKYAAVVRNNYGKGEVTYVGFMPSDAPTEKIVEDSNQTRWSLWTAASTPFPTIMRSGVLSDGHPVHYLLNYSAAPAQITYALPPGKNLLSGEAVPQNGSVALPAWGVAVIEEGVH
jgi:beta-galactosidase